MDNIRNIAWLLMRVQLNKKSTFIFWLGLPIVFTFLSSQQLSETTNYQNIPILSVAENTEPKVSVILALKPMVEKDYQQNQSGMMVMFTLIFMLTNAISLIWERV